MGNNDQRQAVKFYQLTWKPEPILVRAYIYEDATSRYVPWGMRHNIIDVIDRSDAGTRWVIFDATNINGVAAYDMLTFALNDPGHVIVAPNLDMAIAYVISNYNSWHIE